jgi:transforming growth factor-beta-induced protein
MINLSIKILNKLFSKLKILSLIGILFVISACNDEEDPQTMPTENVMAVADASTNLSTLVAAIDAASLRSTISSASPITVFAPTNDAFAAVDTDVLNFLLATPSELSKVLTYHVVEGKVTSDMLSNGTINTLNTGQDLTVNLSNGVMVNNANVTQANIEATNGVVHIIDQVLIPQNLDLSNMNPSIAEAAMASEDLSTLVAILSLDGLSDLLAAASNDDATLTVFAPTNAAFASVLSALGLTSIDEIPESVLHDIVSYHILGSVATSSSLQETTYETLNGEFVSVSLGSGVQIDEVSVSTADITVSNGVVHKIDGVLLPSLYKSALGTVVEVPLFRKDFTILTAALQKAELVSTLLTDGPFTIFAPDNDAFEAAGVTSLDELSKEDLTPILLYHVVGESVASTELPQDGVVTTLNSGGFADFFLSLGSDVFINGNTKISAVDINKTNGVVHRIDRKLVPPTATVVDIAVALSQASEDAEFTTLVALLTDPSQSAVLDVLSNPDGSFTVFAPTDAAFAEISNITSTLSAAQISSVLTYHVIADRIYSTDLANGAAPATVNGETLTVNIGEDGVSLTDAGDDDASVIQVNVNGTNGVIHVIDKVLIPTL